MITIVAIVVIVVVLVVAMRARVRSGRSERRSVDGYGRSLGMLGDVSKRTGAGAPVQIPPPERLGQPHVRPAVSKDPFKPAAGAIRDVPPPKVHLEPPVLPNISTNGLPVFGDDLENRPVAPTQGTTGRARAFLRGNVPHRRISRSEPAETEDVARDEREETVEQQQDADVFEPISPLFVPSHAAAKVRDLPDEQTSFKENKSLIRSTPGHGRHGVHGTVTAAVAAIALVVVGVSIWRLEGSSTPAATSTQKSHQTKTTRTKRTHTSHATQPSNTPSSNSLEPVSSSQTLVTYGLNSSSYTISFSASGPCWIGVESSVNGPYLWQTMLASGGSASYRGSSPLFIRIGAPKVVQLTVNGEAVHLPADNVNPYDVTFTPESSTSA